MVGIAVVGGGLSLGVELGVFMAVAVRINRAVSAEGVLSWVGVA